MKANNEYLMSPVIQIINRAFLMKLGVLFVDYVIHQDNAFTFEVMLSAKRVGYIHKEFYQRRVHTGSIMTSKIDCFDSYSLMKLLLHMLDYIKEMELPEDAEEAAYAQIYHTFNLARNRFHNLSADEKKTPFGMTTREQLEFRLLISDISEVRTKHEKAQTTAKKLAPAEKKIKELEKKLAEAEKVKQELAKVKAELAKTKKDLNDVKTGASFNIGRALTYIPRKLTGKD